MKIGGFAYHFLSQLIIIIYILYIVICLPLKYVNMVHKFVERHKQIGIIIKSENSFRQIKLLSSIFALIFNF